MYAAGARGKDLKWQMPGWRIEQKYSTGVLIGNWSEDRLGKFQRAGEFGNSTHRKAFTTYPPGSYRPDVSTRRKGLIRSDGLGRDCIFVHHGNRYTHNNISLYDQQFNRCYGTGQRQWDRHRLAWLPEASDHPVQGRSTNFGLKETVEERWRRRKEVESHGDFTTTYSFTYRHHPEEARAKLRKATPRHLSSHLHPHRVNKDLQLRSMPGIARPETIHDHLLQRKSVSKLSATV